MDIIWAAPEVQSAAIQSIGSIAAAAIAALGASIVGKRFLDQRYLKDRLLLAQDDIAFLLVVEEEHCKRNAETSGVSMKNAVRNSARIKGYRWSGRFTPGRAKDRQTRLMLVSPDR